MDSLNKEVIEIKEMMVVQHQLHRLSLISGGTLRSSSTGKNTTMVGFDDVLLEIMDKLTRGELDRRITPIVGMGGIDKDESWNLFCKIVFGKDDCPIELEKIGKKIVKNCKGLPLSIVVIGGLLTKYEGTRKFWEYTLENITSSAHKFGTDLYTSFKELPMHLKPCFLYMGIFQEDEKIRVSQLIKLWVAEGFLKPINCKSLEVVAGEYLMEPIDRNLILVDKLGSKGNTKLCKIHDLLRDLCLREAQKQKFLCVIKLPNLSSTPSLNTERRIIIHGRTQEEFDSPQVLNVLQSASLARSLIVQYMSIDFYRALQSADLRFMRTLLQARFRFGVKDSKISMMPLLRHARLNIYSLPDPPNGQIDLENLQTLSSVSISECREKVVERFPNLKTLGINCRESDSESLHCFSNLGLLHKLEHLKCHFLPLPFRKTHPFKKTFQRELLQNIAFPHSLKKLTLAGSQLHWEDITTKIGTLPHLQVLKLELNAAAGADWVTAEGQFCSLKFLLINSCDDFVNWMTDNTHFPRLEHLRLEYLDKLMEIPLCIREIPTLESIELFHCSSSAVMSAKSILEEQEELGNEGLKVRVKDYEIDAALRTLARRNFEVEIM
ncbi:hypothetical protein ACS0TY_034950 [Phlomoides rotata]